MREMKDSGVEWIGKIPLDWNRSRLGNYFRFHSGDSLTKIDIKDEGKYPVYGANGIIGFSDRYNLDGDNILLGRVGACGNVQSVNEKIWVTDNSLIVVPYTKYTKNDYFKYLFDAMELRQYSNASVQPVISSDKLRRLYIPLTSLSNQCKIADYLNKKCSKINEIIEKQQAIIEKLKEYKSSIITESVTKGLNPNVKMKDSGVEWLGKYPAHWNYYAFKNVLFERNEKNSPVKTDERLSLSIDKGVTLYCEKTTNLDRYKDDVSQYKIAHAGDLIMNSMNMIVGAVGVSNYFGCVSPAYYTYYDLESDHVTVKYCDYLMRCKTMRKVLHSLGKGIISIDRGNDRINTCRLKVSRSDLRQLKIPVPPISEQREIVAYLKEKETLIDKTIKDREIVIAKLNEYKKSLIYEVVTGKKEI